MPGRRFSDRDDFNTQLGEWLKRANRRVHAHCAAARPSASTRTVAAMMALPPVLPDMAWRHEPAPARATTGCASRPTTTRCTPSVVGRRIEVAVTADEVIVTCGDVEVVARHQRLLAKHRHACTDPAHDRARERCPALGGAHRGLDDEVEVRDLSVYDQATGVA